ncbi:hypothetical protein AB0D08_09545 [Kitasatospora sp. NPDC048540]|uniref:hypothetical protein n=1 Tax=unclassified Kitasatospora TaxID=2633591 RepID=UPI00053A90E6|nr:hypothetical protein [Kitasatospora sp. MBT63]
MLTLHRAALLAPDPADPAAPSIPDGAVLVDGAVVAAFGPYRELAGGGARVREWGGLLLPGLRNPYGHWLLERAYHPDPREELGSEPLLTEVAADRRGGSARRGLQRMLAYGTTAVAGPFELPAVRTAVTRSGLTALPGDGAPGGLDPLAAGAPGELVHRALTVGGAADFALFEAESVEELARLGAGCCLATVLGGRLVYRRR